MWQSAAFTIHSVVWSCLDAGKKSIVDPATMSVRQNECLSTLVRFCGVVGSNFGEPKVSKTYIFVVIIQRNFEILSRKSIFYLIFFELVFAGDSQPWLEIIVHVI